MGMIANVFRQTDVQHADGTATLSDCTNGGWSSKFNTVTVVNVDGPFEPTPARPGVVLVRHRAGRQYGVHAVSVEHAESGKWTMAGGNFLYTTDSRFRQAVRDLLDIPNSDPAPTAISIHDRIE